MYRNLDLVTLRTLLAIADTGGMTRAANFMHLTQSAVSMQMKRLEDQLNVKILVRDGRTVTPTAAGEQLINYARRMIELNDDAMRALTAQKDILNISFGVPHDIVHPFVPQLLKLLACSHPLVNINLCSGVTSELRSALENGMHDIILTTERTPTDGGIVLMKQPLVWVGAGKGVSWQQRPLPVSLSHSCMFRKPAIDALDNAGIEWVDVARAVDDESAMLNAVADLGVRVEMKNSEMRGLHELDESCGLPVLPEYSVAMYFSQGLDKEFTFEFSEVISRVFTETGGDTPLQECAAV